LDRHHTAEQLFDLLFLLKKSLVRYAAHHAKMEYSPMQMHVLHTMLDRDTFTMTELAGEVLISKQQLTPIVDKLVSSGLVRRDGSPKPAYRVLEGLIKGEWWTKPARFRTDADGRLRYRAFLGQHRASARGAVASFSMEKDGSYDIELTLRA
jgi:hypothetical protein